ncbi:nucleotide exchange factor GrpE [uncultured Pseudoteredinibacter sp.]|uniref:nucleotide exchange factor GrpE n=1 Tax=uncultured Pseudoteredinibacter sp. TaxID=1641701 RepID=UPI0026242011|nr:nucleotide exchange factor GrpE [uncultured Pseudoteredinibacter sp.]
MEIAVSSEEQNPNVDAEATSEAPEMAPGAQEGAEERVEDVNPAELVLQIEGLQAEIGKLKDQELRTQAEMHNVRRRAEQDVEKAHKFGVEKFVGDMLTVIDNLERALASMDAEDEALKAAREGIELTLKSMQDGLKRHDVEAVDPAGEPFDPEFHQAMTMVPNPDLEPNTVMDVFQKGYTLHGRLVRPAMVVVAKAP